MIEQQHAPAALACTEGAHQPGGAGAQNDNVEMARRHASVVLMIQRPATRPTIEATTEPPT